MCARLRVCAARRSLMRVEMEVFCWVARCWARRRMDAWAERGAGVWKGVRRVVREEGRKVVIKAP